MLATYGTPMSATTSGVTRTFTLNTPTTVTKIRLVYSKNAHGFACGRAGTAADVARPGRTGRPHLLMRSRPSASSSAR